ncbi:MAG: 2-oxo acid dehydrogenase subunit E2 [Cognatishimia sp.]
MSSDQTIEVHVPDIGDFSDVPVVEILVSVGDEVSAEDTLIVLESDKATVDVPSPCAGRIAELKVNEDDIVSEGGLILLLESTEAVSAAPAKTEPAQVAAPSQAPTTPPVAPVAPAATPAVPAAAATDNSAAHASPSIRKYARTLGADLSAVEGSGKKGRITREDIEQHVKSQMLAPPVQQIEKAPQNSLVDGLPDWPKIDFSKFGPTRREALSRIGKISGPSLARNSLVIPHVCNFEKSDVTDLEAFRKTLNAEARPDDAKITILAFTVRAVVSALKAYPKFNSSLDGQELIMKDYWNIGVAADTPEGLVVPVVKDADRKGLREIAGDMIRMAGAARDGKLKAADMQGATFTISSLGGIGGTGFTPIINAPEVAILGMTRAEIQPSWDGENFQPRLIQPLSLSWDHRVVDGVAAAKFLAHVAGMLSDMRRLAT